MTETKDISKGYCYGFRNRKIDMWNFMFPLLNVTILDKMRIFSIKNKQRSKYVKTLVFSFQ